VFPAPLVLDLLDAAPAPASAAPPELLPTGHWGIAASKTASADSTRTEIIGAGRYRSARANAKERLP
jgi:hypothetical protein